MKKKLAMLLMAGALAAPLALTPATPANAAFDCGYRMCMWDHLNYSGSKWNFSPDQVNFVNAANDRATSLHNNHGRQVQVYSDANLQGRRFGISPWMGINDLRQYADRPGTPAWISNWNDKISSYVRF